MERRTGVVAGPDRGVVADRQRPGQVGGLAEKLLVEPVAPAAERLCDQHAGCHRIHDGQDLDPLQLGTDHHAQGAHRDRAPDAESALPDVERLPGAAALAEVELVVGGDVVEPAADEAERDGPHGEVADLPRLAAAGHPAALAHPDRDDDPGDDAQRVAPDRERAELPDPLGRAGDGQRRQHGSIFPLVGPVVTRAAGVRRRRCRRPRCPGSRGSGPGRPRRSPSPACRG